MRRRSWDGLLTRVVTALVLAPLVLGVLYAGPPYSDIFMIVVGAVSAWEWARICRRNRWDRVVTLAAAVVAVALAAGMFGYYALAGWIIAAGSLAAAWSGSRDGQADAGWLGLGVAYVALACLAFIWLRDDHPEGLWLVFWLVALIWATDVGAYFAGRMIGGPKLAPAISPNKTWAGLGGGMAAAALVGAGAAWFGSAAPWALAAASAALAIVAQLGDLFESSLKRRYGVKDSSGLLPGHGGLLDRVDGLLSVFLVYGAGRLVTGVSG